MKVRSLTHIWQSKPLLFKQANVAAMQGKLYQFDQALRSEIVGDSWPFEFKPSNFVQSTSSLAMYPDEIAHLEDAFSFLAQSTAGKSPTVHLTSAHVETVAQILDRWPASQRFPGIHRWPMV
jgi:phospholipase A-2-activating protein